jgi:hypothetical protein
MGPVRGRVPTWFTLQGAAEASHAAPFREQSCHPLQSVGCVQLCCRAHLFCENMLITVALAWVYRSTIDSDMELHLIRVSSAAHSQASRHPAVGATKCALIRRPGSRRAAGAGPAGPPIVSRFSVFQPEPECRDRVTGSDSERVGVGLCRPFKFAGRPSVTYRGHGAIRVMIAAPARCGGSGSARKPWFTHQPHIRRDLSQIKPFLIVIQPIFCQTGPSQAPADRSPPPSHKQSRRHDGGAFIASHLTRGRERSAQAGHDVAGGGTTGTGAGRGGGGRERAVGARWCGPGADRQ